MHSYLVSGTVKHLFSRVVNNAHKPLICRKVDLTKFNYHTLNEYDFSSIFLTKSASSPLWQIVQARQLSSNSIFVIRRYHCWYKPKKNWLQMKYLGDSLRLSRNNCVLLQKNGRGLWKRGHHERISQYMISTCFVPFLSREKSCTRGKNLYVIGFQYRKHLKFP